MWDDENKYYADSHKRTGEVSDILTPASFMPLYIGIASDYQAECMKTVAESGLKEIEMVVGDEVLKLTPEFVKQFILQLEAYAYKCFVVTAKHQQTIKSLEAIRDILDYNYTTGYPDKVTLE